MANRFTLCKTTNSTLQGIFFYHYEGCHLNDMLADSWCMLWITGSW